MVDQLYVLKMNSALAVAHYLVRESARTKLVLTPFKIEFMVYFAHGWNLAVDGRPLINEKIKAHRHGPVIETVNKFYSKIKKLESSIDNELADEIKDRDHDFLSGILMYYGHLNELEMQSICTEEGTPWFITYKKSSGALFMDNQKIKQHYRLLHVSNPEFCDLDDPITMMAVEANNH